ncbi:hypothetical protein B0A48_18472 [Cryoendolithus antarcticus]|uniref:Uncharacterized protein n=1 Tax=Cryoendolithus antarcticus TaxID=1507870 RepID=A0A1V8S888_9PEZI|nr:hypothetical protein B0A48_18472 [Cryoendolithus antarcticus]
MKETLTTKLLERECSDYAIKLRSYRKLYSDRSIVKNLDIVNELDGHSGCVNALSWSKSGNLLASGSDDQHLNIHRYQAPDGEKQFQLAATVATGHRANIFSVKFMPHSQDRTVITAAGDNEVRVFDLEYAGQSRTPSAASNMATEGRRRGRNSVYDGVRYMNDGDTDCRVYRSHGDRVKRIVTESSPHLFLTCSEDGEVRQWDLRQPSSAYPSSRGGGNVPPPLISYKRFNLSLNSISCSGSQPHYIALGGGHLHAFLHDRRMTGRDRGQEAGAGNSRRSTTNEEDQMGDATRCVRKFAPHGQQAMASRDNGHITALKISDARPDEMIVSWSGDHVYSFDLIREAEETASRDKTVARRNNSRRSGESLPRKRKRKTGTERNQTMNRFITTGASDGSASLRIRYQNGQEEQISIPNPEYLSQDALGLLTNKQREAQRLAKATVRIRKALFDPNGETAVSAPRYTTALGHCASILSDLDRVMQEWTYPMEPMPSEVSKQRILRLDRESTRRFVQTAGVLSRVLGGRLQTPSGTTSPLVVPFTVVEARRNDLPPSQAELFGHDFSKAITLWLDSGLGRLIEGFTRSAGTSPSAKSAMRLPIPESEASAEAIDEFLIPYLMAMATDRPIYNPSANQFETDVSRQAFPSEQVAVTAFAAAVKVPFADLSSAVIHAEGSDRIQAQDRQAATRFWAAKVGRGVLMNAAEDITLTYVDRAFGGLGRVVRELDEATSSTVGEDDITIGDDHGDEVGVDAEEGAARGLKPDGPSDLHAAGEMMVDEENDDNDTDDDDNEDEQMRDDYDDEANDSDHAGSAEDESSSEPDEEDGVPNLGYRYHSAWTRQQQRSKIAANIPCSASTRTYRGHCNVKTVKDVNFFGLDDEYVVSGSDDGNFFIWDRRTTELVNVLEGDGEVVNVIQSHPYEPMLAVSGIDHTIKIFSPDSRAREAARLGREITAHDADEFSSIAWPHRLGRRGLRRSDAERPRTTSEPAIPTQTLDDQLDETYVAPTGLTSRRRMHEATEIMARNDVDRRGGNQDSLISRSMLMQLATRLHAQRTARGETAGATDEDGDFGFELEGGEEGEDGQAVRIQIGEDCVVM